MYCRRWKFYAQTFQMTNYDLRNSEIAEPFMVYWDDEPGRFCHTAFG